MLTLLALDLGNAAKTILGIGGLIFVHELGHFLVGRACGVKAEAFSIGFGPVIAKWQPGETEYRLSAVPLGGYVKFLGENPDERGEPSPRSFFAATYPRKVAIMLAGVTMNVIAAFVLFVAAFSAGVDVIAPVVGSVAPGLPAAEAGVRPGDRFVSVNGHRMLDFSDVAQEAALRDEVEVVLLRDGRELPPMRIPTKYSEEQGHRVIGVMYARDPAGEVVPAPGTAAERSGLKNFDRVVAVGGTPVANLDEAWARSVAAPDGVARWTVQRNGATAEVDLPVLVHRLGIELDRDAPPGDGVVVRIDADPAKPSAARDAGLPDRARIVAADGATVASLDDLRKATAAAGDAGRAVKLLWRPSDGGDARELEVRPARVAASGPEEVGVLVPALRETIREGNVFAAAALGLDRTHRWVMRIFATLRSLVTGTVSAKKLQGPIQLARSTYETADTGWPYLFMFLGMISMNLAVLNVLPVPLLDGGQLAIITAEKIRGKPLPERVLEGIQWTGLILLVSFMLFVFVNDLRNL